MLKTQQSIAMAMGDSARINVVTDFTFTDCPKLEQPPPSLSKQQLSESKLQRRRQKPISVEDLDDEARNARFDSKKCKPTTMGRESSDSGTCKIAGHVIPTDLCRPRPRDSEIVNPTKSRWEHDPFRQDIVVNSEGFPTLPAVPVSDA
ncbi:hypothetical protein TIFTF001_034512 [Ficus carica]|uniref:Uncharacterized protein n=1 Tax=Ficus carica TaxID=3494 RepID=A0AA88E2Y7_FICCA|nr:hypothetical protein TIFTF001_034512 [Ficus carica]